MIDQDLWHMSVLLSDPRDTEFDDVLTYEMNYERLSSTGVHGSKQRALFRDMASAFVTSFEDYVGDGGLPTGSIFDPSDEIFRDLLSKEKNGEKRFPELMFDDVRKWTRAWIKYRRRYKTMSELMLDMRSVIGGFRQYGNALVIELESLKAHNERLRTQIVELSGEPTEDLHTSDILDEPTVRIITGDIPCTSG